MLIIIEKQGRKRNYVLAWHKEQSDGMAKRKTYNKRLNCHYITYNRNCDHT